MRNLFYAFILGLCFSVFYSYILHPIHLTAKYGDKVKEILEKEYSEYSDLWIFVQGDTKHVIRGVILNTGQNFLIVDIKLAEYDYKAIKVMIVGDKK